MVKICTDNDDTCRNNNNIFFLGELRPVYAVICVKKADTNTYNVRLAYGQHG